MDPSFVPPVSESTKPPLSPTALEVLRGTFGYESFRPGQEKIINAVLAGRDRISVSCSWAGGNP